MKPPNDKLKKPPRLLVWLNRRFLPDVDRDFLSGDFEEVFVEYAKENGYIHALFWYLTQSILTLPEIMVNSIFWRMIMIKNYIKIALRNIQRHKIYSVINIAGLALGIACCTIIFLWVQDELSFDRFHENGKYIYRIVGDWERNSWDGFEGTPGPLGPAVQQEIPEVVVSARVADHARKVFRYGDKVFYEDDGVLVDPSFFDIFTFPFVRGDPTFTQPTDLAISETLAEKYFGATDPIGKNIEIDGELTTIIGVFKNPPQNSHLQFQFVSSFEFITELSGWGTNWGGFNFVTYVHLSPHSNLVSIGERMTEIALKNECSQVTRGVTFRVQPLYEIHLDARDYRRSAHNLGDASLVYAFTAIAIFVLIIACVNFMNLSTARSAIRSREVGMRKAVGARRVQVIRQFFGESILLAVIAGVFAAVLVVLMLPQFNALSGKNLQLHIVDYKISLAYCLIVLCAGLFAGIYPALMLSSFKPAVVLKESKHIGKRGSAFRRILVVFQFALSIFLIIATLVLNRQMHFIRNRELGFDKDNVVFIPIKENLGDKYGTVKAELQRSPHVNSVSASWNYFPTSSWRNAGWQWEGRDPERERNVDIIMCGVDYGFFETLNIDIIEGRTFSREFAADQNRQSVIFNEAAIRAMDLDMAVGKWFNINRSTRADIIGIAKDVHFQSLRREIHSRVFFIYNMAGATREGIVLINIKGGQYEEALADIEEVWNQINPVSPFEYRFLDQAYDELYRSEQKTGTILNYFTWLAVIISSLGLFGLASFIAERRTKEIGIRKVMGASIQGIIILLSKEFTRWVLIANLVAWPAGYFVGKKLLQNYAYKVSLSIDLFVLSGLIALVIAVLTVSFQAFRAARSNPVDALRYE